MLYFFYLYKPIQISQTKIKNRFTLRFIPFIAEKAQEAAKPWEPNVKTLRSPLSIINYVLSGGI